MYNGKMNIKIILQGQVPAQKNNKRVVYNRRTGKPFIISDAKVKNWQAKGFVQLKSVSPVVGAVEIEMVFYNKDKRKRDIDNMLTSVLDLLKNSGIIEDDNCFIVQKLSARFGGVDKINPRAEVSIITLDKASRL